MASSSRLAWKNCFLTLSVLSVLLVMINFKTLTSRANIIITINPDIPIQDSNFNDVQNNKIRQKFILLQSSKNYSPPNTVSQQKYSNNTYLGLPTEKKHEDRNSTLSLLLDYKRDSVTNMSKRRIDNRDSVTNISVNKDCKDKRCTSLISFAHKKLYKKCEVLAYMKTNVEVSAIPNRCTFRDGKGRDPVALVSVPGSGNTWVRGLLEKATGICTGSIYCDYPLRVKGFVGEYVHDSSVLVVKTHTSDYQWRGMKLEKRNRDDGLYGSAILLIRNPFDTFVAERHRSVTLARSHQMPGKNVDRSHTNEVGMDYFGSNPKWDQYVRAIGERWGKTILMWAGSAHREGYPLLIVTFEDLKKDSLSQVQRMLDFLHYDYERRELEEKLKDRFDEVHRHHSIDDYEHYTRNQTLYVRSMVTKTVHKLQSMGIDHEELMEYTKN